MCATTPQRTYGLTIRLRPYDWAVPVKRSITRWRRRIIGLVAVSSCALAASGCGASDERFNSGEVARAMDALGSIEVFISEGRCDAARRRSNALAIQSTHVGEDRPELGEAYASSVAHLQRLITRDCIEITPDGPTPPVTGKTGPTTDVERPDPTPPTERPGDNTPGTEPPGGDNNQPPDTNEPGDGGSQQPDPDTSGGAAPGA